MSFKENILLALEGLRSNKTRSLLTMLGVIIGIAAVIGILTVGDGFSNYITDTMSTMGASTIGVSVQEKDNGLAQINPVMSSMMMETPDDEDLISQKMIAELEEQYSSQLKAVALSHSLGSAQAIDGHLYANVSISGTNDDGLITSDLEMLAGRFIKDRDDEGKRMVCVVSDKLVKNMFDSDAQKALGNTISVKTTNERYTFRIVGVYEYEENPMMPSMTSERDMSTTLYIPVTTAKYLGGAGDGFSSITVQSNADIDSVSLAQDISDFLNRYYRKNEDYCVSAISMDSIIETMGSLLETLSIAISVIAAISLLVGGIGVMNIMLVSVTERTREIGTRKALGATNANIRIQFVVESAVICLIGGVIGMILGTIMGYVGSNLMGAPAFPTLGSIALAIGFSLAVGIFFGYYPANKAAKLDPIEALRYE
ncbi:MAG: ABC transporter permease [Oscillospiraceae bacterium]|nr:ABC transporter permease [Oscillospiraceae bacterium]